MGSYSSLGEPQPSLQAIFTGVYLSQGSSLDSVERGRHQTVACTEGCVPEQVSGVLVYLLWRSLVCLGGY